MTLEEFKKKKKELLGFDCENEEECIEAVKQDGCVLRYVKDQTPEICLVAVKENGYALQFVKEQTPEICLKAVKENGRVLKYVKEQTEEMCLEAVKQNGWALEYVKEQTEEMCLEAVKQDGSILQYVKNQTPEICLEAIKQDSDALIYINYNMINKVCKKEQLSERFKIRDTYTLFEYNIYRDYFDSTNYPKILEDVISIMAKLNINCDIIFNDIWEGEYEKNKEIFENLIKEYGDNSIIFSQSYSGFEHSPYLPNPMLKVDNLNSAFLENSLYEADLNKRSEFLISLGFINITPIVQIETANLLFIYPNKLGITIINYIINCLNNSH